MQLQNYIIPVHAMFLQDPRRLEIIQLYEIQPLRDTGVHTSNDLSTL